MNLEELAKAKREAELLCANTNRAVESLQIALEWAEKAKAIAGKQWDKADAALNYAMSDDGKEAA